MNPGVIWDQQHYVYSENAVSQAGSLFTFSPAQSILLIFWPGLFHWDYTSWIFITISLKSTVDYWLMERIDKLNSHLFS